MLVCGSVPVAAYLNLGSLNAPVSRPGRAHHASLPRMVFDLEKAAEPRASSDEDDEVVGDRTVTGQSYREQFEELFSKALKTNTPVSKPSNEAQKQEQIARQVPFSTVFGTLMRSPGGRQWTQTDVGRSIWFVIAHAMGVLAWTRFFSWRMLGIHFFFYCACGMGITYSYHRQLAHRACVTRWNRTPGFQRSPPPLPVPLLPPDFDSPLGSQEPQVARVRGIILWDDGHSRLTPRVGGGPPLPPLAYGNAS